ncbi:MAG TPA: NUDIX domain-containing protein [Candidatus Saccharimonadia bacterium]|nr:NUDIX domain-containing protein [Candidatus Saccharimonadia bacterium]
MNKSRTKLLELLRSIVPYDDDEKRVLTEVRAWIRSDAELYRGDQPDEPSPHLVAYVVLVDRRRQTVLLFDHRKSGLWLPAGGHVERGEDPAATAARELIEELGLAAAKAAVIASVPLFVTANQTRGAHGHVDVSLWYVVDGSEDMPMMPDPREFRGWAWRSFEEVLGADADTMDPQIKRFVAKLRGSVGF